MGRLLALAGLALAASGPAAAHHSVAAVYDRGTMIELRGAVTELDFRNPHSFITLSVPEGRGVVTWRLETGGLQQMERAGFGQGVVALGETVIVKGSPAHEGGRRLWLETLETGDGKAYAFYFRP